MPRRSVKSDKKFKRRTRKRPTFASRRKFSAPRKTLTYNTNVGLGTTKRVKMNYYEQIGLASTSGVPATHTFNLASIFDPDFTGTGHQPYGHDQWATMYKQYYVAGAWISVKWTNISTNNIPHKCFVLLDKDNTTDTNLDTRMEQTKGVGTKTLLVNSNNSQVTKAYYSPKKFFNFKNLRDEHQIRALMTANPVLPCYAKIGIQPIDQVSSTSAFVYGEVMITYDVVLFDPIPFAGS